MKRKVCIVTGTRADYGYLMTLMKEIKSDSQLSLQIVATGTHLSKSHGLTYRLIEKDGFKINKKLNILKYGNTENGVVKSLGLACSLFADAFNDLKPDVVVLLGDRYETLAACISAYINKIPIAHIAGGEVTEGQIDEGIRHSITKMASIHFASTDNYRKRIIQLGEQPSRVFNFGSPGLDPIKNIKLFDRKELSSRLKFDVEEKTAIFTYHPVTLEKKSPKQSLNAILKAIKGQDIKVIFTKANADPKGDLINKELEKFAKSNPLKYRLYDNLGQQLYYSCLRNCEMMIGNSSSGLTEAPSFHLPVVNVGDRQRKRERGKNVIDVKDSTKDIQLGIKKALSSSFKRKLRTANNPYAKSKGISASQQIKNKLKTMPLGEKTLKKSFFDIPVAL